MEESEAIARLRQGDIRGLDSLVVKYQLQAIRAAYLIVHDRALAEDIVQVKFIQVYERIAQFDSTRPFGPWFLRGVVNDALTAAHRAGRQLPLEIDGAAWAGPADSGPGPDELLEAAETKEEIWQAVCSLPPEQRAAVVLRYYLGLSEGEMAGRLGAPPGTVKWRLHAARRRLREMLPAWLKPGGDEGGMQARTDRDRPLEKEGKR